MWARLRHRLRYLIRRDCIERELAEEMDLHRRLLEADKIREGLDHDTAVRAARRQFGNASAAAEYARDAWVIAWLDTLGRDLRFALRRLGRGPAFTAFGVLTLALGIGATTGVYSVVQAATGPAPGVRNVDRLVDIGSRPRGLTWPDYQDLRASRTVFERTTAWAQFLAVYAARGRSGTAFAELVCGDYFTALGVTPARGRLLLPDDDRPDASPVVVLAYSTFQRVFGGDDGIVGQAIKINGHGFTVVGVAAPEFHGLLLNGRSAGSLWVPLAAAAAVYSPGSSRSFDAQDPQFRWLTVKGLLASGRTVAQAGVYVETVAKRLDTERPLWWDEGASAPRRRLSRDWTVRPMTAVVVDESVDRIARGAIVLILAAVGVVLLVACTNLANLTLARGTGRREEFALRLALGSSRARLVREALLESAVLATAGGMLGLGVARVFVMQLSGELAVNGAPVTLQLDAHLDLGALVVCMVATVMALGVAGLGPAWQSSRQDVRAALVSDAAHGGAPRWRGRRLLIVGQVCGSVVLLALAALCAVQLRSIQRDPGFAFTSLAVADIDFAAQVYDGNRIARVAEAFRTEMPARKDAAAFTVATGLPMGLPPSRRATLSGDTATRVFAALLAGDANLLTTLDVPIIRGRGWDARDPADAPIVVLSAYTARRLFGTEDVVGRTVRLQPTEDGRQVETREIIGVTANTIDVTSPTRPNADLAYMPLGRDLGTRLVFLARATGNPDVLASELRDVLRSIDPDLAPRLSGSGPAVVGSTLQFFHMTAEFATTLGTFAWGLALAGLYGVLSHLVLRRTREIGLRVALGASRRDIVAMVVRQGLGPVATGVVAGLVLAALLCGALQPFFREPVRWVDLLGLAVLPLAFVAAAGAACYLPARRAASVDPNVALRET